MADVLRRLHAEIGSVQVRLSRRLAEKNGMRKVQSDLLYGPLCEQSCHFPVDEGVITPCEEDQKAVTGQENGGGYGKKGKW
jgi:hypothetical protein